MEKKKIIIHYFQRLKNIFLSNFPQNVILILILQFFIATNGLPYVNIIDNYYIYVFILILLLTWVFFFKYFTSKRMLVLAITSLLLAYPAVVLGITQISETLGFVAYLLIIMAILQKIVIEKKLLSNGKNE